MSFQVFALLVPLLFKILAVPLEKCSQQRRQEKTWRTKREPNKRREFSSFLYNRHHHNLEGCQMVAGASERSEDLRSTSDGISTPRGVPESSFPQTAVKLLQPETQALTGQPCRTATTGSWLFGYKTRLVAPKPGEGGCLSDHSAENPATTKSPNLRSEKSS
jgi:hypothetical protein